ncbi:MAG: hypothetical protein CL816_05715 [Coxiellaceae bacterium]|nr:hypothetical protein [Coxiellaceae bacterium]
MGYIYNTPDRGNASSQVSVGALKEIHFPIQLGNNKKGDIFIEIHDPKERRQQEKQHPDTPILKGSNHFGQVNYIDDDERFGSPHAVAVARVRSFHSELSTEDLRLAAVCLIHLSNTIERIGTIHDHINKNKGESIKKFEKHMQKTHIQALAIETSRLDEALEALRDQDALLKQLIDDKVREKIPNYRTYQSLANDKENYNGLSKPYHIFEELDPAKPLNENEMIKPRVRSIRFPLSEITPTLFGGDARLSSSLLPDKTDKTDSATKNINLK